MADKEISALTDGALTDAAAAIFHGVTGGNSRKFTGAEISGAWVLAGGAYTAAGVWDQSVDGTVSEVDFTGLAGMTEFLVIAESVTKSGSGNIAVYVSVDNGSTFPATSGDYVNVDNAGAEGNTTRVLLSSGSVSTARSHAVRGTAMNISGIPKPLWGNSSTNGYGNGYLALFKQSTSPVNAVRVKSESAVDFSGGKIYCLVRY